MISNIMIALAFLLKTAFCSGRHEALIGTRPQRSVIIDPLLAQDRGASVYDQDTSRIQGRMRPRPNAPPAGTNRTRSRITRSPTLQDVRTWNSAYHATPYQNPDSC